MSKKRPSPGTEIIIVDGQAKIAKTVTRQEAMERAEMFVARNLTKYLRKLHELSMGITVVKDTKAGPKIYQEAPDRQALQYLIDRGLGKIPDRVELTGEDGGAIAVVPWLPSRMMEDKKDDIIEGTAKDVTDASE